MRCCTLTLSNCSEGSLSQNRMPHDKQSWGLGQRSHKCLSASARGCMALLHTPVSRAMRYSALPCSRPAVPMS
eukprot:593029-Alexandrium_andersonii.AAC.1